LRKIQKELDGYERRHLDHRGNPYYIEVHEPATGDHRERLLSRKAQLDNQLEYDRKQIEAAEAEGTHITYGPHNVHVGDTVHYWRRRSTILKVNRVTVSADSGYSWPDKVKFTEIRGIECPHGEDGPTVLAPRRAAAKRPAAPKVEVPQVDTDQLKAKTEMANVQVSRSLEAFVSPPMVVDRLMELADIHPGMAVLEPSAGTGNIAAAAVERGAVVDCVEISHDLANILVERVPDLNRVDIRDFLFLARGEERVYDRVVMNPPFSDGKDLYHVAHATKFVKPGGLLVAVMGASVIYRQTKDAERFRAMVDERGGWFEPLPAGSFAPATNANTVIAI
ncbi:methyltransferase, partial [Planotetraspora phitsanulokensis]